MVGWTDVVVPGLTYAAVVVEICSVCVDTAVRIPSNVAQLICSSKGVVLRRRMLY